MEHQIEYVMGTKGKLIQKGGRAYKVMVKGQRVEAEPGPVTRIGRGPPPVPDDEAARPLKRKKLQPPPLQRQQATPQPYEEMMCTRPTYEERRAKIDALLTRQYDNLGNEVGKKKKKPDYEDPEQEEVAEDEDMSGQEDYGDEPQASESESDGESDGESDAGSDLEFTEEEVDAVGKVLWETHGDELVEGYQALGGSGPAFQKLMQKLLLKVLP